MVSQQKQLHALQANKICTKHAAAFFYQSDCWRQAVMSESERESRVPTPLKKQKRKCYLQTVGTGLQRNSIIIPFKICVLLLILHS